MRSKEARAWSDRVVSKPVVARNVIHRNAGATISWQNERMPRAHVRRSCWVRLAKHRFAGFAEFVYY